MENVHDFEKQADKVGTEYDSRVDDDGILICLGTRFGATDLYSELRDKVDWDGESPMWTYFAQPAVFDMPDPDPNSWVTLWPAMWPGLSLAKKKAPISDQRWQTTYQQQDASRSCRRSRRKPSGRRSTTPAPPARSTGSTRCSASTRPPPARRRWSSSAWTR
jgi:hypothetical protein